MPVERKRSRFFTFERSLKLLRRGQPEGQPLSVESVKVSFTGFVQKLQSRYPFTFVKAYRDLQCEINRQAQERYATHFLFGALAELTPMESPLRDKVWRLGGYLGQQLGKGGENFCPREFNAKERGLAHEIGEQNFDVLVKKAEELSLAMRFKMGPVNSAEHVIAWTFRYVGQLLKAARWEASQN